VVWVDMWCEKDARRALETVAEWAGWGARAVWWLAPDVWHAGRAARGFREGRGGRWGI
jgi:hypothetical protein